MNSKINLLIGLSGSIAAVRILEIVSSFHSLGKFNIKIILTKNAKYFTDSVITNYNEFENTYNTKIYYLYELTQNSLLQHTFYLLFIHSIKNHSDKNQHCYPFCIILQVH